MRRLNAVANVSSDAVLGAVAIGALTAVAATAATTASSAFTLATFGGCRRIAGHRSIGLRSDPLLQHRVVNSVVGSDYRYTPKDRTQYIAYLRMKRDAAPLGVWQAQQAYFGWMLRNVSVHIARTMHDIDDIQMTAWPILISVPEEDHEVSVNNLI